MQGVSTTQSRRKKETEVKEVVKEVIKEVKVPVDATLKIKDIEINKKQPRKQFNEESLNELSESIKLHGVIEPLVVTKRDGYYLLVSGERRWRAAMKAGLKEVPVVIKDYTDQQVLEIGLIENIQRENLNPIEEAKAYKQLIDDFGLKQDEIANRVSKNRSTITNIMRLLKLSDKVQKMVIDEELSNGHARALLAIEDDDLQYEVACYIVENKLSVREIEKYVKNQLNRKESKKDKVPTQDFSYLYREIEENFKYKLGSKTTIKSKDNDKGKIEIEFYSKEELEHIMELIYSINN